MEKPLFRQKSLERISSPEQLQDYMRVTNPSIWMVLAAVIALLLGGIACAAAGRLETKLSVSATANEGVVEVKLSLNQGNKVEDGMPLRVAGQEAPIEYTYYNEDGYPVAAALIDLPDGVYDAEIVIESIAPISFLLND